MGQYYRAVTGSKEDGKLTGIYEMDGWKLMEFAYADDSSLAYLMDMLVGRPQHLVFMGDYGDDMPSANENVNSDVLMNIYREAWARDDEGCSLRNMLAVLAPSERQTMPRYYINHTKKKWFDLMDSVLYSTLAQSNEMKRKEVEKAGLTMSEPNIWVWAIHPIAILCSHGNGQGGGDYGGYNEDKAGLWAWDVIETAYTLDSALVDTLKNGGYDQAYPVFFEK